MAIDGNTKEDRIDVAVGKLTDGKDKVGMFMLVVGRVGTKEDMFIFMFILVVGRVGTKEDMVVDMEFRKVLVPCCPSSPWLP